MKSLLNWQQQRKHFPLDVYTWKSVLGESLYKFFLGSRFLRYGNSTIDSVEINGNECQVEYIDGKYFAIGESDDIELAPRNVLQMFFDKTAFADFARVSLGAHGAVSELKGGDGFCIGDLSIGKGYRAFLCFSDSALFARSIAGISDLFQPLIISFGEISSATQKVLFDKNGKFFSIGECFEFRNNSMYISELLKSFLKTPQKKQNNTDYYCWAATGHSQPENPTLDMLRICVLSTTHLRIVFNGKEDTFEYRDISIFRNENTGEMNTNWTCLRLLATKQEIPNDDKGKQQAKRLNKAFREFFGFGEKVVPFSFKDGLLCAEFNLTSKKESYREHKEIFDESHADFDYDDFRGRL